MKKLIIIFFLAATTFLQAQGSTTTPYDTLGWDAPTAYTTWYSLRIFELLSNPGGGYNRNMRDIDSLLYELVVYTDSLQLYIQNDTLKHASYMSGQSAFTGTEQYDTVTITGIDSSDVVVVSVREAVPAAEDILGVTVQSGQIICNRQAAGTSGLKWNWIWIRKY